MDDIDDFELINDTEVLNEETFEPLDLNDANEKNLSTQQTTVSTVITPPIVSKTLMNELPQVVKQPTSDPVVKPPIPTTTPTPSTIADSSIKKIDSITSPTQSQTTVPSSKRLIIPPVPSLPKAPAPQRYGDAALIPHSVDQTAVIEAILNKSKTDRQNTLATSIREQQKQQLEIQAAVEQRQNLFQRK